MRSDRQNNLLIDGISLLFNNVVFCTIMKHRSREDIILAILKASIGGETRARIAVKAFVSFSLLTGYLPYLIEKDLIAYLQNEIRFKTTPRGMRFIQNYEKIGLNPLAPSSNRQRIVSSMW